MMRRAARALLFLLLLAGPVHAVQPDEVLADPALETRARGISAQLRCMVCQNQSIDDSDADLARDLRLVVRDRLQAGDSDSAVIDYVVARYGEFVLLKPLWNWRNALLWGAPALILLVAGTAMGLRARRRTASVPPLDQSEEERLRQILERP
ncbi:MAG: cytochrome c-type biogenesis protein CcmH [Mesorhizobium amorphae]|nr:MAG: cytochrome c-type biogenesis protein CcmH [Mesorhizobium amorphae]